MIREYDVTPREQGSECKYQRDCEFYKFGIWCNKCTQYLEFDDLEVEIE